MGPINSKLIDLNNQAGHLHSYAKLAAAKCNNDSYSYVHIYSLKTLIFNF